MNDIRPLIAVLAGSLALAGPASAQTTVTRSKTVTSGQPARLEITPNLKKDCSVGSMPEYKVSTAPQNGSVVTKSSKLKTPANYRCPNKEAGVVALFYKSNPGFTGSDAVTLQVKNSEGQVETYDIRITVGPASSKTGSDAKKEGTDL